MLRIGHPAPPSIRGSSIPVRTTCHSIQMSWKMQKMTTGNGFCLLNCNIEGRVGCLENYLYWQAYYLSSIWFSLDQTRDINFEYVQRTSAVSNAFSPETSKIRSNAAASVKEHGSRYIHLTWKQPFLNRVRFRGSFSVERKRILRKRELMRLQFLRSNNRLESIELTPEELGEWVPCEDTKEDDPQLIVNNLLPCTNLFLDTTYYESRNTMG